MLEACLNPRRGGKWNKKEVIGKIVMHKK